MEDLEPIVQSWIGGSRVKWIGVSLEGAMKQKQKRSEQGLEGWKKGSSGKRCGYGSQGVDHGDPGKQL